MNIKKIILFLLIAFIAIGIIVSAADAAHTVKKGKYSVKISNKEYKKLTSYKTKYKTETRTRIVEKTKTKAFKVEKIGYHEVTKTEKYKLYYDKQNGKFKRGTLGWSDRPQSKYYEIYTNSSNYNTKATDNLTYHIYKTAYGTYNTTEAYSYTDWEFRPYKFNETEKYNVTVPYKVRKDVTITKKTKKYVTVKEIVGEKYKKVKVPKTIGKRKYIGKTYAFFLRTHEMKKDMDNRIKKLKKAGWKIHNDESNHEGVIGEDGFIYHYCYCTKKVYKTEKKFVGFRYKKVKTPVKMTIETYSHWGNSPKTSPRGKVLVSIWSSAGPITCGTVKIK